MNRPPSGTGWVAQVSSAAAEIFERWNRLIGPAIIFLAAAAAVTPQLLRGNSCGHDFDFHLVSWLDAQNSWRHGIPYPHWTPSANFGAGEPRFVFYPPLTWMLGATLGLILPWTLVPVALTFLLLAGTGLATRALAQQALSDTAATLAGCAALFSGYALFTAYERSAFAELAGGFWIPLVLLFILRDRSRSASLTRRVFDSSTAPLALSVAGAWLSNPTVGVMACYLLAAVALTLTLLSRSWTPALRAAVGAALGMGLAAVYLVPAAWERRWVDILQVTEAPGQMLENNWLFARHANPILALHDEVLHTVSIIAVLMIAVALGGFLVSWLRGSLRFDSSGPQRWWVPLALIPVAVLFLQFPFSRPLWNLLPDLRFLQFPWRWLIVLEAPMAIFFVAAIWPGSSARLWRRVAASSACIAVFLGMTAYAGKDLFQSCDDEDAVAGMLGTYRSGQGFPGTDEYEPIGTDNSIVATGLPLACLVSDPSTVLGKETGTADSPPEWEAAQGTCKATYAVAANTQPEHIHIVATPSRSGFLILRLRTYPAWRVKVYGRPVIGLPQRQDGLMAVPVSQGPVDLTVDWTTTPDDLLGRWLNALALLLLIALWLLERRLSRPRLSPEPRLS